MALRQQLELLLARGQDSPLLRFSLGDACLKERDHLAAIGHLQRAVELNEGYSAAWKLLGQACVSAGLHERAGSVFERGIAMATERGDVQAAKEMRVFLRRLAMRTTEN